MQGLLYLYVELKLPLDGRNTWTEDGKINKGMAKTKVEEVTGQGRMRDNSETGGMCMVLL